MQLIIIEEIKVEQTIKKINLEQMFIKCTYKTNKSKVWTKLINF